MNLITLSQWQCKWSQKCQWLAVQPLWREKWKEMQAERFKVTSQLNFPDILGFTHNAEQPSKCSICAALSACLKRYQESFVLTPSSMFTEGRQWKSFQRIIYVVSGNGHFDFDAHECLEHYLRLLLDFVTNVPAFGHDLIKTIDKWS